MAGPGALLVDGIQQVQWLAEDRQQQAAATREKEAALREKEATIQQLIANMPEWCSHAASEAARNELR